MFERFSFIVPEVQRQYPDISFIFINDALQVRHQGLAIGASACPEQLAGQEPNGVLYANQWENLSNGEGHYRSTGPEIWQQTDGKVDAFCCAIGTGGTLSGVGRYLKEQNPAAVIALTDPVILLFCLWLDLILILSTNLINKLN